MSSERNNFVFGRLTSKAASYIYRNWKLKNRIKDDLRTSCKVIKYSRRVAWRGGSQELCGNKSHERNQHLLLPSRIKEHLNTSCAKNYLLKV